MNEQRRLLLFMMLTMAMFWAMPYVFDAMGWNPRPVPAPAAEAHEEKAIGAPLDAEALARIPAFADFEGGPNAFANDQARSPAAIAAPRIPVAPRDALVLGEADPAADPATSYHMRVRLTQKGAGVERIELAYHGAEAPRAAPGGGAAGACERRSRARERCGGASAGA